MFQTVDGIAIMTSIDNREGLINSAPSRVSDVYRWEEFKPLEKKAAVINLQRIKQLLENISWQNLLMPLWFCKLKEESLARTWETSLKIRYFMQKVTQSFFQQVEWNSTCVKNERNQVESISFWGSIKAIKI